MSPGPGVLGGINTQSNFQQCRNFEEDNLTQAKMIACLTRSDDSFYHGQTSHSICCVVFFGVCYYNMSNVLIYLESHVKKSDTRRTKARYAANM